MDTAAEYTVRLIDELLANDALPQSFFLEGELDRTRIAFVGLRGAEDKFRGIVKVSSFGDSSHMAVILKLSCSQSGLDHLFNQLLRPRLRPLLSDVYKDVTYVLDEDSYAEAEYRDDVRKRFVKAWESLLAGYRVRPSFLHDV